MIVCQNSCIEVKRALMHKTFETNQKKIKGDCQLGRKMVTHDSNSDLPLAAGQKILPLKIQEISKIKTLYLYHT